MTMETPVVLAALLGHAFLWIGLVNRLHAVGVRRWIIKLGTVALFVCAAAIPIAIGGWWRPYTIVCWTVAATTLLRLVWLRGYLLRMPPIVRFHGRRSASIDLGGTGILPVAESHGQDARATRDSAGGGNSHHFLARLPYNEILRLDVSDWTLDVPRMAAPLDGLSVVHLSDFHFTGRVGKAFFREVVRISNQLQPDLVAVTGDIVDTPACLDWIADTLGRLTARHGVYFILGNHDRRTGDVGRVRRTLEQSGLVDLGGRQRQIDISGCSVLLAGNERPWIDQEDRHSCLSPSADADALRIALAHCPDQLRWARAWNADLMLAGHTHGGQIRIPPLGAIFSPTRHGVKYVSGVFYSPPTILHVSRGVSGDVPLRWNCPPEIACLRLRSGQSHSSRSA
jgi:uncharacterized protein